MGLPSPPVELAGHCSIVYNSTLYTYSPSAFQSIELQEGGSWKELPMGIAVTGGVCVKAIQNGNPSNDALFVVGGTSNDTSSSNYPGLQRYSFSSQSWESISPIVAVTQNRLNHAAIYLNSSASILVYAGSQDGDTGLSSQTFLISTTAPYGVQAFTSTAPPSVNPMLLPWNNTHAVMVGGSIDNKAVFTFEPTNGWQNLGVVLPDAIHDQATISCSVISGDDGSKVLETFNMGVSPNQVSQLVLLAAGGAVATTGQTIGSNSKAKRELTLENWPTYNSTLAPTNTRSSFSIAQDDVSGQAVVSGGNADDPLCIFDQRKNTWMNATQVILGNTEQISIQSSPTATSPTVAASSTSAAAAATSSVTTVVPAAGSGQNKSRMLTVLGATLGTILGIAAILIIILLLLRWRKQKKREQGNAQTEKDRLSFADRGAEFMREAGGSANGHYPMPKAGHSSLSIMQGRIGHGHKRGLGITGSDSSTVNLVAHKKSPLGYSEPLEMASIGEKMTTHDLDPIPNRAPPAYASTQLSPSAPPDGPQHGHSRSSGWSRYFSNNEATNLANMTSGRSTYASERTSQASQSQYTESRIISQPSQAPPPLELNFSKFDGQRVSRVATGSPSLGHSREDLHSQPMQAELARANSVSSTISSIDGYERSANANAPQQPAATWTPVAGNAWSQRPPSSTYTESNRGSAIPVRDGTSSYYPTDNKSSYYAKSGISTLYGLYGNKPERDSTVTVFPRGIPAEDMKRVPARANTGAGAPQQQTPQHAPQNSDMSWLNLGVGTT